jgi:hypothetical protein
MVSSVQASSGRTTSSSTRTGTHLGFDMHPSTEAPSRSGEMVAHWSLKPGVPDRIATMSRISRKRRVTKCYFLMICIVTPRNTLPSRCYIIITEMKSDGDDQCRFYCRTDPSHCPACIGTNSCEFKGRTSPVAKNGLVLMVLILLYCSFSLVC